MEIWRERRHICEVTGEYLGNEPLKTMFHHLLNKENYPEHKWDKWNIILVRPDIHEKTERLGNNWHPIIEKRYLEALEKHRNFVENQEKEQ